MSSGTPRSGGWCLQGTHAMTEVEPRELRSCHRRKAACEFVKVLDGGAAWGSCLKEPPEHFLYWPCSCSTLTSERPCPCPLQCPLPRTSYKWLSVSSWGDCEDLRSPCHCGTSWLSLWKSLHSVLPPLHRCSMRLDMTLYVNGSLKAPSQRIWVHMTAERLCGILGCSPPRKASKNQDSGWLCPGNLLR